MAVPGERRASGMRAQRPTVARVRQSCIALNTKTAERERRGTRLAARPYRRTSRQAMAQDEDLRIEPFTHAAGGWTSIREVAHALGEAHIRLDGTRILLKQNKPDGFQCVSCSWAQPAEPHAAEFCEHGAKATAWELTTERCTPEFFAQHTLTELEGWSDLELESQGRLTAPMRWDAASDKYVEVSWH